MKKIFLLCVLSSLVLSHPLRAGKGFSRAGDILDLSDICIVANQGGYNIAPGGWKRLGPSVESVISEYIAPHADDLPNVRIVDLSTNNMPTDVLNLFVTSLKQHSLWERFKNVEIISFQHNNLTEEAAPVLENFLEWNTKSTLPYLDLVNTPVARSHVNKLARALKNESMRAIPDLMSHLVFVSRKYLPSARTKVQCYKDFVRSKELPQNWSDLQNSYYQSSAYKSLGSYYRSEAQKSWLTCVQKASGHAEGDHDKEDTQELANMINQISLDYARTPNSPLIESF